MSLVSWKVLREQLRLQRSNGGLGPSLLSTSSSPWTHSQNPCLSGPSESTPRASHHAQSPPWAICHRFCLSQLLCPRTQAQTEEQ